MLLKERVGGKKNSRQEGRAFKMNEIVQRGCELCMLHCETGADSPGSSESCHRSNMPQTYNLHIHTRAHTHACSHFLCLTHTHSHYTESGNKDWLG